MKTAEKLASLSVASVQKTSTNTCRKCNSVGLASEGFVNGLVKSNDDYRGEPVYYRLGQPKLTDCLKCSNCGHSWRPKVVNPEAQFQKKVKWGSHQYVRYVIKRCEELAKQGYGAVGITIDETTDQYYGMDKGRNSCYSSALVVALLKQHGFTFGSEYNETLQVNHYDAFSDVLVWKTELPQAPKSQEIGMSWE